MKRIQMGKKKLSNLFTWIFPTLNLSWTSCITQVSIRYYWSPFLISVLLVYRSLLSFCISHLGMNEMEQKEWISSRVDFSDTLSSRLLATFWNMEASDKSCFSFVCMCFFWWDSHFSCENDYHCLNTIHIFFLKITFTPNRKSEETSLF